MATPLLPLSLVLGAVAADGGGAHRIAFYLVLLAIPSAAATAFSSAADLVEGKRGMLSALAPTLVLILLVLGSAARSNEAVGAPLPRIAVTAAAASLVVYGLQAVAALVPRPARAARPARERA